MSHRRPTSDDRVLVTGASSGSAMAVMRGIDGEPVSVFAADVDPYAPGLYQVPPEHRLLLPQPDDPGFADALLASCRRAGISVLLPTIVTELLPIAARVDDFGRAGIRLMLAPLPALERALDRMRTRELLAGTMPVVPAGVLTGDIEADDVRFPADVVARRLDDPTPPITARGSDDLRAFPLDGRMLVETPLDGAEVSVDVLRVDGRLIAAVPRLCLRWESGVAVTGRTLADPVLQERAARACEVVGIDGVATVRFRRDVGEPHLVEIAPHMPDGIALTIAAGVNMPGLWLRSVLGRGGVSPVTDFQEVAMTRTPLDQVVPLSELSEMSRGFSGSLADIAA